DDVGVVVEAVHLDEDLVQRLLALVVPAAQAGAAHPAHRVDLVYEDDARGHLLGLVEQVEHAARADADEHLDKLRAGNAEERHARFSGDGAVEQRLARARLADHQHALRHARPEPDELLRLSEELDDLRDLVLGLLHTGHVVKGHDRLVDVHDFGAGAPEAHRLVLAAAHRAQHREGKPADDQQGNDGKQRVAQQGGHTRPDERHIYRVERLRGDFQQAQRFIQAGVRVFVGAKHPPIDKLDGYVVSAHRHPGDFALAHQSGKLRHGELFTLRKKPSADELQPNNQCYHQADDQQAARPARCIVWLTIHKTPSMPQGYCGLRVNLIFVL